MSDIVDKIPNNNINNNDSTKVSNKTQKFSNNNSNNKLLSIQKDIIDVRKQYNELESLIASHLKNNNHSLNHFMKTLKTISYNQNVLENKLEDLMKNQMNTDILVNNMNQRLNFISTLFNNKNLLKKISSNKDSVYIPSSSNNYNETTNISKNNSNIVVNSLNTPLKRGPGRPRKDQTKSTNNNKNNNNTNTNTTTGNNLEITQINNDLSAVNVSLPTGDIQISKSKRYFIDPLDSQNNSPMAPLPTVTSSSNNKSKNDTLLVSTRRMKTRGKIINYTEDDEEEEDKIEESNKSKTNNNTTKQRTKTARREKIKTEGKPVLVTKNVETSTPPKRKRGRPPKLRTVETVILRSSSLPEKKNSNDDKQSKSSPKQNFNNVDTSNFDNTTIVDQTITNIETNNNDTLSRKNSTSQDIIDAIEKNNDDISNPKTISTNNNSQPSIPITKIIPFKPENENEKDTINKDKRNDEHINDKSLQENKEQQRKLDRLRDSREKMLTSLKYNDRARAKSFMESNKELLMALKLEERRKRLSANYEHPLPVSTKQIKNEQTGNNDKKTMDRNDDSRPMNKEQSNESNFSNIEKVQEMTTKENINKMKNKQKTNDTTAKIDKTKIHSQPQGESLSNIVNQRVVDNSVDHVPFDNKKPDLLNLLNSDSDSQKNNNELEKVKATKSDLKSKSIDSEIESSNKKLVTSDTTLKLNTGDNKVNYPYNLRTKRKLTDLNDTASSKVPEESSIEHTTKKVKLLSSDNLKENEIKIDLKKNNMVPETKNVMKEIEIEKSLDTSTVSDDLSLTEPIELVCKDGFFYNKGSDVPITSGAYLKYKFKSKEKDLLAKKLDKYENGKHENYTSVVMGSANKYDKTNVHILQNAVEQETEFAYRVLSQTTLTESYVNSLEYFIMEFRWENKLVGLGLKLSESKRTWQRRKALFTLFDFWRDQSIEKRNFPNFTMLHAIKEMENYRIFINRSVSWFYNHITLLKMILYDLCDNVDTQWRDWMFPKDKPLPVIGGYDEATKSVITVENINAILDKALVFDLLDDGTENNEIKQSQVIAPKVKTSENT